MELTYIIIDQNPLQNSMTLYLQRPGWKFSKEERTIVVKKCQILHSSCQNQMDMANYVCW